jgi:very-short-patch-repair endonuclease
MAEVLTQDTFVRKSADIHNGVYCYSKSKYINARTKIEIICRLHGSFWQLPYAHSIGKGCNLCKGPAGARERASSTVVERLKSVHGGRYTYEEVLYTRIKDKINITCHVHGVFTQSVALHLRGHGCPKCYENSTSLFAQSCGAVFAEKSNAIHENRYEYKDVVYINARTKVKILCRNHGGFMQSPNRHLSGNGCPVCGNIEKKMRMQEFVRQALDDNGIKYICEKVYIINGKRYRVDFLLTDILLHLEVDEKHHRYTVIEDAERQRIIHSWTGLGFIRIDASNKHKLTESVNLCLEQLRCY